MPARVDLDPVDIVHMVGRYNAGECLRDLAAAYGHSTELIRRTLRDCGVILRPRGGRAGVPHRR